MSDMDRINRELQSAVEGDGDGPPLRISIQTFYEPGEEYGRETVELDLELDRRVGAARFIALGVQHPEDQPGAWRVKIPSAPAGWSFVMTYHPAESWHAPGPWIVVTVKRTPDSKPFNRADLVACVSEGESGESPAIPNVGLVQYRARGEADARRAGGRRAGG